MNFIFNSRILSRALAIFLIVCSNQHHAHLQDLRLEDFCWITKLSIEEILFKFLKEAAIDQTTLPHLLKYYSISSLQFLLRSGRRLYMPDEFKPLFRLVGEVLGFCGLAANAPKWSQVYVLQKRVGALQSESKHLKQILA